MQCTACSNACSKLTQFVIPNGTSKTTVAIYQCRGCKTVIVEKVEKDN